jgi:hypothetical protein
MFQSSLTKVGNFVALYAEVKRGSITDFSSNFLITHETVS